jgi:2'-hydroxyisoflavone reductase
MKLLILGGTQFLGRHVVDAALARGHEVTLFNRGKTNPNLYPELEKVIGDRDGGLGVLKGRKWDAVVDPSGYIPRLVKMATEFFAGAVEHYTFISSISVYSEFPRANMDESGPLSKMPEGASEEEVTGESYGPLKVLCEQAADAAMPGRVLNVRAGLIVGPHDPTDRFTYWVARVNQGGEMVAPESPDYPTQFIDGRDLGGWIVKMAETRKAGIYNATGTPTTFGDLLSTCQQVSQSGASLTWVGEKFLLDSGVQPWQDLPIWIPRESVNLVRVGVDKALADGLTFRPLETTVRDTLDWNNARGEPSPHQVGSIRLGKPGLDPEKETKILHEWHARVQA